MGSIVFCRAARVQCRHSVTHENTERGLHDGYLYIASKNKLYFEIRLSLDQISQ